MTAQRSRLIVLAGAGHAHLYTLARAAQLESRGHRLAVVGPCPLWYSGLATGMLGGNYSALADQLDQSRILSSSRVQLYDSYIVHIDSAKRTLELRNGVSVPYDLLSINVGSEVAPLPGEDRSAAIYAVKPIANLWRLRQDLETAFAARPSEQHRVLVVGAGATGCELGANVAALARRRGARVAVDLIGADERLVPQLPARAAATARRVLERNGVQLRLGRRVAAITAQTARLDDGTELPFDALVNATGLRPSSLLATSGLPLDDRGALSVDRHLRSLGDPLVFGGGDCISIEGYPLPMIGVYAIREAPVLYRNLLAAAEGRPLERFTPQRHYLWIINFGDGTGLASRHRWWWHGRAAFRLKDWLDRRFLDRYRR